MVEGGEGVAEEGRGRRKKTAREEGGTGRKGHALSLSISKALHA